jgi:ketosteroid isomerase-like protein
VTAFNAHDAARIATLYAPDARMAYVDPAEGWKEETGSVAIQDVYRRMFEAFPDIRIGSPHVYQSNDVAIQEWVTTGTRQSGTGTAGAQGQTGTGGRRDQTGTGGGQGQTGASHGAAMGAIGMNGASVYWFDDTGRIVRDHAYADPTGLAHQGTGKKSAGRAAPQAFEGEPQFITATGRPEDTRWLDQANSFFADLTSRNNEKAFLGLFAKDATFTYYDHPADRTGAGGAREIYRNLATFSPDLRLESKSLWGFGDRVVAEVALTGTHKGAYLGARATNKPATMHELDILRFDDTGKIVEISHYGSPAELTAAATQGSRKGTTDQTPGKHGTSQSPGGATQTPGYNMNPGHNLYPPGGGTGSGSSPYPGGPGGGIYPGGATPPGGGSNPGGSGNNPGGNYPGSGSTPGGRTPSPGGYTPSPGGAGPSPSPSPTQNNPGGSQNP